MDSRGNINFYYHVPDAPLVAPAWDSEKDRVQFRWVKVRRLVRVSDQCCKSSKVGARLRYIEQDSPYVPRYSVLLRTYVCIQNSKSPKTRAAVKSVA
jgi:hypothetical protein